MRVALLTDHFWPEVRRGTERFVHDLARGLIERGHHPLVVTLSPGPAHEEGVPVARVHGRPAMFSHARGADFAHAFGFREAAVAIASRRPAAFSHMGIPDAADLAAGRGRRSVLRAIELVVLTEAAAEVARDQGLDPAAVITPGVDLGRFALGSERSPQPTVICAAAADEPRKRVDLLLAAWTRLPPGGKLLLDRRTAPGRLPPGAEAIAMDDDLAGLNARAWAAVLPAESEAFGLTLLEALATGTPGVARTTEVIDHPAIGRTFDGSVEGLAAALAETLQLARNPATRHACRARAAEFALPVTVERYEQLYLRAAAPGT